MIKAYSLFSGSTGNCFYVDAGDDKILIDAGVSARRISGALACLGATFDDISAIFVTHEHSDHIKGLETISKYHDIPIHTTAGTARAMIKSPSSPIIERLFAYRDCFSVSVGSLNVSAFPIPHDASQPVGYTVSQGDVKIGFCTDTGRVTEQMKENLLGCRAAVIESNHDVSMLMLGSYPYPLKLRILSDFGHLSNDAAGQFASFLAKNGTSSVMLAHLSRENNTPETAFGAVMGVLGDDVNLSVASPENVSELIIPQ